MKGKDSGRRGGLECGKCDERDYWIEVGKGDMSREELEIWDIEDKN
ncbi:hypothetical protein [Staphylococcus aureus]|nr:hypothetical protein [Staphylococcus aureus]